MEDLHEELEKLYLSPSKPSSLGGIDRLWKEARKTIPGLKRKQVVEFLQTQYAYTRHKAKKTKFVKRKVIAVDINDVYQMDLVDLQKFSEFNDDFKYLLTAIDCFSRYAFAIPLKSKKPKEVIEAISIIFKEYGIPQKVFTDKGSEFLGRETKSFFKELHVQQWYSYNPGKAVQVERFNRTLKERLWVLMTDKNNYRYIDDLADVVKSYNNSVHSSTGFAPSHVGDEETKIILENMQTENGKSTTPLFSIGDKVRVATEKMLFEKGYEANFSDMIFKIVEVRVSGGHNLYQISDLAGKREPGWFYEKELSKVVINDREKHRISKILKERKVKGRIQYLIHWLAILQLLTLGNLKKI